MQNGEMKEIRTPKERILICKKKFTQDNVVSVCLKQGDKREEMSIADFISLLLS